MTLLTCTRNPTAALLAGAAAGAEEGFEPLFDGKTLDGWEGNLDWFRIEDGAVVAGSLQRRIPHNEFLATEREFGDFELRLEFKLLGEGANAGVQIRSQRVPNSTEMIGLQIHSGPPCEAWYRNIRIKKLKP